MPEFKTEGDINISTKRAEWYTKLPEEAKKWLKEDSKYFLHQALSTPCLNVISRCNGIYFEDVTGKKYMDFHGNNVHHIGFGHPEVINAIKEQMNRSRFVQEDTRTLSL